MTATQTPAAITTNPHDDGYDIVAGTDIAGTVIGSIYMQAPRAPDADEHGLVLTIDGEESYPADPTDAARIIREETGRELTAESLGDIVELLPVLSHLQRCRVTLLVSEPDNFDAADLRFWRAETLPAIEALASEHGYAGIEVMHASEFATYVAATHGGRWYYADSAVERSWSYFRTWEDSGLGEYL